MSDEGDRTCPLCAEEMDMTDQQLKPCKCGYEICIWCWHHILDMAEKDDTEGRCPACRSPYDKEKIVGMAANCERLVAETSMERKMKNQKAKSKLSEGRKQLSSVRVIQRNLVYIVGLPLNLADEDLLQRRDYFGQYGKVLKVSMSRTASGVIQQFPNSTCSVYITYSKEEEAIRCIQSVHGFVLDGKPLRACFGTTKYCHAWLRNVPCSNPDCLYLHEVGSQEDSFTKDEIISAYTRSRVQQITGATNNMQRTSGNVLPPPVDDYVNGSSAKPIVKNASSNSSSIIKGSPPDGSPGRSVALPPAAAWGTRATSCQPPAGGLLCPNGPSKPKPDTVSSTLAFSSAVAGTVQASASHGDRTKRPTSSDGSQAMLPRVKNESLNPVKQYSSMDNLHNAGEKTATSNVSSATVNLSSQLTSQPSSIDSDRGSSTVANTTNSTEISRQLCRSGSEVAVIATNEDIQKLCSDLSSTNIDRDVQSEQCAITRPSSPPPDCVMINSTPSQGSQNNADKFKDSLITTVASKAATSDGGVCISREQRDWRLDSQAYLASHTTEVEDDVMSFDNQRLKDPEVSRSPYLPKSTGFVNVSNYYSPHLLQHGEPHTAINAGSLSTPNKVGNESLLHASSQLCNGYPEKLAGGSSYGLSNTVDHSLLLQDERGEQCIGRFSSEANNSRSDTSIEKGESSIISNILSMDFDPWDDSLTSPQNLAKLLGDNTDNQSGSLKNSWKVQNNNQSRFSFARQEESKIRRFDVQNSYGVGDQLTKSHSLIPDFAERDLYLSRLGIGNGFPASSFEESENLGSGHLVASSNKLSAVTRAQVTAPPGFSVPNRAPPPGFSSHERLEQQTFDHISGNSLLESSSLLRNSYQMPTTGNIGVAGDIEFNDPAILAVGKGRLEGALNSPGLDMRSNFTPQLNYFENDARLQFLMQQSLSQQQNLRFSEIGNTFSQLSDSYGFSSRLDQSQVSNLIPFPQLSPQQSRNAVLSNGQWDGWNEVQSGNGLGVAEFLRNERLGLNKFYAGYEDSKYRMQNSGDLYHRTFGM